MTPVTYILHPLKPPTTFLSFRFYNLMASSGPNPNVSFFQFQDIFNTALTEYAQRTGIDITANPITASLLPGLTSKRWLDSVVCSVTTWPSGRRAFVD